MKPTSANQTCAKPGRPRDEALRTRIQQAAASLLIEGGFLNLTTDAIAQRAGTSKATIYRWWPNKVQIVIDAFVDEFSPQLPIQTADTLEEFLSFHIGRFVKAISGQSGRLLSAVIAAAQVVPAVHEAYITHWLKPRRELLRIALLEFQRKGSLSSALEVEMVLDAMYGPLHFMLMVQRSRLSTDYAQRYTQLLLNGIRQKRR
jgi:AcrR family transcriptional regulator